LLNPLSKHLFKLQLHTFTINMENPTKWIQGWCNLFPEGVRSGGYNVRSKPEECIKKMQNFCKQHPDYTEKIIFEATIAYLKEQYTKGWEYTKVASYFISKLGQPSLLEQYCERILQGVPTKIEPPTYNSIDEFI
jgi:hypothetical protein